MATTTTTYTMPWGETLRISADLSQAAAGISFENAPGEWSPTPYQTADARHDQTRMLRLVVDYLGHSWYGSPDCPRGDACSCLEDAVEGAEEVEDEEAEQ